MKFTINSIEVDFNLGWNNQDCRFFDFDFFKEREQTIILLWNINKTESANGPSLKIQMNVQHCFTPMLHWYDALDMPTWSWHVSSFGIEGPIIMFLAFRPAQSGVRVKTFRDFYQFKREYRSEIGHFKGICTNVPMFLSQICEVGGLAIISKRIQPNFIRCQRGKLKKLGFLLYFDKMLEHIV